MAAAEADVAVERQAEVLELEKSHLLARLGDWEMTVAPT